MWYKLGDGDHEQVTRREASIPMLEANIEALSEFSLVDNFKSSLYDAYKRHEKVYLTRTLFNQSITS